MTIEQLKYLRETENKVEFKEAKTQCIRVQIEVLSENGNRVLVIKVPPRPIGKPLYFEDIPLMRVGGDLKRMSDEIYLSIIQEQEPDFSATICNHVKFSDLDNEAIEVMRAAYAEKQNNPNFITLSNQQALSDLNLIQGNKVTYAAIVLLGKKETIAAHLPQSAIHLEYRNNKNQIVFDNRQIFCEAYFIEVDKVWNLIDLRNGKVPVQQGAYIFDIPYFNKEVIREALNNAVAHRDYRKSSEVVIKQFPNELHIVNPGGFPLGVTLENLLTVNSTPRNRLLADVMAKTGVVERAGQGVDKIFFQSISEAKPEPDYTHSDNYQVELRLSGLVEDKAFALFIKKVQQSRKNEDKLSVQEVIILNKIRKGDPKQDLNVNTIKKLESEGLVERIGKTSAQKLILSKEYYVFTDKQAEYSVNKPLQNYQVKMMVLQHLQEFGKAQMKDFFQLLQKFMTRDQVRYLIDQMVLKGQLDRNGKGKSTLYQLSKQMQEDSKVYQRAMELGLEEMKRRGELSKE